MLDKDKIFIVIYLDVEEIAREDVHEYVNIVANNITFDESVYRLIIPTIDDLGTRVECINPKLLTEEQYKEAEQKVKDLTEKVENALKTLKKDE